MWYARGWVMMPSACGAARPCLVLRTRSVGFGDHLTAGAGTQGLEGAQRHAVAQKVDRAVRHDDIRSAPVAATVRPEPFVLQVAAWRAIGSKRPGDERRRELPVDRRRGIPGHIG